MSISIYPKNENNLFYNRNIAFRDTYGKMQDASLESSFVREYFCAVNQVPSFLLNSFYQESPWITANNASIFQSNCLKFMLDSDGVKSLTAERRRPVKQNDNPSYFGYTQSKSSSGHDTSEIKSKIWRPFSPPPSNETFEQRPNALSCSRSGIFHIKPSNVKLGESKTSLFKAVKSRHSKNRPPRIDSGSKPFRCEHPNCFKSFSRNEELTRHKRIHSGVRPFLCTACGRRFGRRDHLRKHLQTHIQASERKVHICSVSGCGHRYTRSDALARHKSTAHSRKDPP